MKYFYLIIGLIFPLITFAELVWDKQEIEINPTTYVEKIGAEFYFTNTGSEAVTITDIRSSCGCCTTANLDKKYYKAGESGFIKVEFKVGTRTGLQQKHILITTDSINQAYTQLTLKVHLPEVLKIAPTLLEWKLGEENKLKEITIEPTGIVPVKVIGVESPYKSIDAKLKVKENGKSYEVAVQPLKLDEPIQTSLKIQTLIGTNATARWFFAKVNIK